jgi:hypothetical protein
MGKEEMPVRVSLTNQSCLSILRERLRARSSTDVRRSCILAQFKALHRRCWKQKGFFLKILLIRKYVAIIPNVESWRKALLSLPSLQTHLRKLLSNHAIHMQSLSLHSPPSSLPTTTPSPSSKSALGAKSITRLKGSVTPRASNMVLRQLRWSMMRRWQRMRDSRNI